MGNINIQLLSYPNCRLITFPHHRCLVYLPTFTIKNQPNVGKYTIHGCYGIVLYCFIIASCPSTFQKHVLLEASGVGRSTIHLRIAGLVFWEFKWFLMWLWWLWWWWLLLWWWWWLLLLLLLLLFFFRTSWQLGLLKKQKGNSTPMFADREKSSVGSKFQGAMSNLRVFDKVSISISKKSTDLFSRKPDAFPHCYARFPEV